MCDGEENGLDLLEPTLHECVKKASHETSPCCIRLAVSDEDTSDRRLDLAGMEGVVMLVEMDRPERVSAAPVGSLYPDSPVRQLLDREGIPMATDSTLAARLEEHDIGSLAYRSCRQSYPVVLPIDRARIC